MKRDVNEQYREELLRQERRSNERTLFGFVWLLLALSLMWVLTATGIFIISLKLISIAYIITLMLVLPSFVMLKKCDLTKAYVKYYFLTLVCIVAAVVVSFLSIHATFVYVMPMILAIQYRSKKMIWYVYVVNMITMFVSTVISYYYGICDLNLLLGYQNTRGWFMERVVDGSLTIPLNHNIIFVILLYEQFPRSVIFFLFSVVMQYTVKSSNEDAYKIAQLTHMKETDSKTSVFNKGKYEEMVLNYYPKVEKIAVSFWDLNNLKTINDAYGHEMGDKAIDCLSSTLFRFEDDESLVFRIGGDEFLLIKNNPKSQEMEEIVQEILSVIEGTVLEGNLKVSTAVGIAYGDGKEILEVVKAADEKMYADKKARKMHTS